MGTFAVSVHVCVKLCVYELDCIPLLCQLMFIQDVIQCKSAVMRCTDIENIDESSCFTINTLDKVAFMILLLVAFV